MHKRVQREEVVGAAGRGDGELASQSLVEKGFPTSERLLALRQRLLAPDQRLLVRADDLFAIGERVLTLDQRAFAAGESSLPLAQVRLLAASRLLARGERGRGIGCPIFPPGSEENQASAPEGECGGRLRKRGPLPHNLALAGGDPADGCTESALKLSYVRDGSLPLAPALLNERGMQSPEPFALRAQPLHFRARLELSALCANRELAGRALALA
ncbi:MAG: hypothetical protein M3327_02625, partial [Actinomycetota bacterium]|nr:hypothetical protein [Actinomycetota bacterium]